MIQIQQLALYRAASFLVAGLILLTIAAANVAGTNSAVRKSLAGVRSNDVVEPAFVLSARGVVRGMAYIADGLTLGLLAGAFICGVVGVALFITALEGRTRPGTLVDLQQSLQLVLANIQVSALKVLEEVRQKEGNVQDLDQRVSELTAIASMTEAQADALSRRISKGARAGIVLGALGIVVTVALGVWQVSLL